LGFCYNQDLIVHKILCAEYDWIASAFEISRALYIFINPFRFVFFFPSHKITDKEKKVSLEGDPRRWYHSSDLKLPTTAGEKGLRQKSTLSLIVRSQESQDEKETKRERKRNSCPFILFGDKSLLLMVPNTNWTQVSSFFQILSHSFFKAIFIGKKKRRYCNDNG